MRDIIKLCCFMGCAALVGISSTTYAASYADDSQPDSATNNQAVEDSFYVNFDTNYYHMDFPNFTVPVSSSGNGKNKSISSTTSGVDLDNNAWAVQPGFTIGYQLDGTTQAFSNIFGNQTSVEFRYSYAHASESTNDSYSNTYVNPWYIYGDDSGVIRNGGDSLVLESTDYDYDDTLQTFGLFYTGKKLINNNLINSPYVGISLYYLEQDDDYTLNMRTQPYPPGSASNSTGSDDMTSYYYGINLGDKLIMPVRRTLTVFGDLGVDLLGSHNSLDASQVPNSTSKSTGQGLLYNMQTYKVSTTDDKLTYRAKLEIGTSYYITGVTDPNSIYVTLKGGAEYWADVAYADNPTQAGQEVDIAYDDSLNYYAGLQVHVPID